MLCCATLCSLLLRYVVSCECKHVCLSDRIPYTLMSQKGSLHLSKGHPIGLFPILPCHHLLHHTSPPALRLLLPAFCSLFHHFQYQFYSFSLSVTVSFLTWSNLDMASIILSTLISAACSLDFPLSFSTHDSHPYFSVGTATATFASSLLSYTFFIAPAAFIVIPILFFTSLFIFPFITQLYSQVHSLFNILHRFSLSISKLHSIGALLKTIVFDLLQFAFSLCLFNASCSFSTFYFRSSSLSASSTVSSANMVT